MENYSFVNVTEQVHHSELNLEKYSRRSTARGCLGLSSADERNQRGWDKREGSQGRGCHPDILWQAPAPTRKRVSMGEAFLRPTLWTFCL